MGTTPPASGKETCRKKKYVLKKLRKNQAARCAFFTKRLFNNLNLFPFCTTWFITTVQSDQILFWTNRLWQPVSWIGHQSKVIFLLHLNKWAVRDSLYPIHKRMHKKTSRLRMTASAYTCNSNHPWRIIQSSRRKIDTSQDSQVY